MTEILLALIAGLLFILVLNSATIGEDDPFLMGFIGVGLAVGAIVAGAIAWGIAYGFNALLGRK